MNINEFPKYSKKFGNLAFVFVTMLNEPERAFTKLELDKLLCA